MDEGYEKNFYNTGQIFKRSLERIIAKYSKLQDQDECLEVDLNNTSMKKLQHYMRQSKKKMDELESTSLADSREESVESQDSTTYSQLDGSHEKRDHEMSTHQGSDQDDALSKSESSEMIWSSSDESQRNISAMEPQPKDEDTKQEMFLSSQDSSLADLYPNMISQIERAWHRQYVSDAANSVLRRYRKWRHLPNKSNQSVISNTRLRRTSSNSNKENKKTQINKTINSNLKKHLMGHKSAEAAPLSSLRIGNNVKDCQVQHHFPGKGVGLQRKAEQHPPILVMDLSSSRSEENMLNRTFTVFHKSPQSPQSSAFTVSPSKAQDIFFRYKGSSLSPLVKQTTGCSTYTLEDSKQKPDIYSSPVRQSPFKARLMSRESLGGIPHAFSVSPKSYSPNYSQERKRLRLASMSLSPPPQTSIVPQRTLYYQDPHTIVRSQVHHASPSSVGRQRLRRHLSFDSSALPSTHTSAKELDDNFIKVYHKFVCQSMSPLFRPPCRLCEKSSEPNRGHSSSALAALALSPHRSLLRKRHKEMMLDDHLQSKLSRERYYTNSPGSRRYFRDAKMYSPTCISARVLQLQ